MSSIHQARLQIIVLHEMKQEQLATRDHVLVVQQQQVRESIPSPSIHSQTQHIAIAVSG